MTKRECAIVTAYTDIAMLQGNDLKYLYEYLAELFGRPVYTHEFFGLADEIKRLSEKDFIKLCRNATLDDDNDETSKSVKTPSLICTKCGKTLSNREYIACGCGCPACGSHAVQLNFQSNG